MSYCFARISNLCNVFVKIVRCTLQLLALVHLADIVAMGYGLYQIKPYLFVTNSEIIETHKNTEIGTFTSKLL